MKTTIQTHATPDFYSKIESCAQHCRRFSLGPRDTATELRKLADRIIKEHEEFKQAASRD